MLVNGDFSDRNWRDVTIPEINLTNQEPAGWHLEWIEMGQPLYDDNNNVSRGIPECVHKLDWQLPPNEQLDAKDALILAGDATYKIFSASAPFGTTLSQTVTGLQPGEKATLTVPIQVHMRGETDPYGAESGVWVNGIGGWVNCFDMGDRRWYKHVIEFDVPENGEAEIVIRVKSKWAKPKDFFFDGITLDAKTAVNSPTPPPIVDEPPTIAPTQTVFIQLPPGVTVKQGRIGEANVIEINVGPGVRIEIV